VSWLQKKNTVETNKRKLVIRTEGELLRALLVVSLLLLLLLVLVELLLERFGFGEGDSVFVLEMFLIASHIRESAVTPVYS